MERENIVTALNYLAAEDDFSQASIELFAALGYRSDRTLEGQSGSIEDFITRFPALKPRTKSEYKLFNHVKKIYILFQLTDEEISKYKIDFRQEYIESFLFIAVQLNDLKCQYRDYLVMTTEINKRFSFPVIVIFHRNINVKDQQYQNKRITIGIINRRLHKNQKCFPGRQVLE